HSGIGAARAPELESRNELQRWINERRRTLLWDRDGRESSVALSALRDVAFIVNGKSDGSARSDAGTQVMSGLVAAVTHPRPTTALVVGLGTGSTSGWLAAIPTMQRVDTVELEPVVLDVARACEAVNARAMSNPKSHITIGDAREVLLTTDRRYDIITSEPSNPYRAGIASLFTREFYLVARSRLTRGGIFAQWIQTYAVHPETVRTVYATLTGVFPHVHTWWTTGGDLMLIASVQPLVIDADALRARLREEPLRSAAMNAWRVDSAEGFLARLFANEDFARAAAKQAETINTDDRTVIEFGFARSIDSATNLHDQIARDAMRLRATRPRVRGAVDWTAVERMRPWLPRGQQARNVGELAQLAIEAAQRGDARAEAWAQQVARVQPVEADLILATLRARQNRLDEATALLRRSFLGYRRTAWPQPGVMEPAFQLALDLAESSPQRARILFDALSQPFAAMQHENSRLMVRIAIAPMFDRCGPQAIAALQAVEPYPAWTHEMLTIRANCYALARLDTAEEAWEDLARWAEAAPSRVVR
ncbi:MAG TPA: fused MFS/spermidine synthase, partial [Thermoanaerobaculia bacterium]|nr:fused MFS/spermidine synthase [Thermoanaerobaculia bacterium]